MNDLRCLFCYNNYKISTTPASTDVIVFRLEIESRLVLLNNKFIFEAYFSLFIGVYLGLPARTDGFYSNLIVSALLLLIALDFVHLFLYQLHRFILIVLWDEFLVVMVSLLFVESDASAEFIKHVEFYIFQMILLEIVIVKCFHADAALQLLDWFGITEEIWYLVYPLWLLDLLMFCGLLGLGIASTVYSHHLVAWWHVFIPMIIEVVVVNGTLIVFAVGSEVLHLHAFIWWSLSIVIHLAWVSYLFCAGAVVRAAQDDVLGGRGSLSCLVVIRLRSWNFSLFDISSILFLAYGWILESFLIQAINAL